MDLKDLTNALVSGTSNSAPQKEAAYESGGGDMAVRNSVITRVRELLGREPSEAEIAHWVAVARKRGTAYGETPQQALTAEKFEETLAKAPEHLDRLAVDESRREAAKAAATYKAEAPLRGLAYAALSDVLNSQYGQGEGTLKSNLAARGLLDSGSLGAGLTSMYNKKMQDAYSGGLQIETGGMQNALASGQALTDYTRKLQIQSNEIDANQTLANQKYQAMYNMANMGQKSDNPWKGALTVGGALAGGFLSGWNPAGMNAGATIGSNLG